MTPSSVDRFELIAAFSRRPFVVPLECGVRHYDWGQRGEDAFIPKFLGLLPEGDTPYAEAWIGDHPGLPSFVRFPSGAASLPEVIRSSPDAVLGAACRRRFGDRLPYLIKILAAVKPLSIQVHPGKARAEDGFRREQSYGYPPHDPRRNYRDDNHKPEILIALTDFYGLNGFRSAVEIAGLIASDAPELASLMPDLRERANRFPSEEVVKDLVERVFGLPQRDVNALLTPLLRRLSTRGAGSPHQRDYWLLQADRNFSRGEDKDRGLFFFYLLNFTALAPGQAMYVGPGDAHSYLSGVGVEVMANSDNVLRGGLTFKHVDVPEFLGSVTFSRKDPQVLLSGADGAYPAIVREFSVERYVLSPGGSVSRDSSGGPEVWVCLDGSAHMRCAGNEVPLTSGAPLFVPGSAGHVEASTSDGAMLFRVFVPPER
jgi:mannose-6-phosphate isomerase class I